MWRKVGLAEIVTLPSKKGGPTASLVTLLYSSQLFVPRVKGSPSLVRKGKDKFSSCKRGITDSNNLIDG